MITRDRRATRARKVTAATVGQCEMDLRIKTWGGARKGAGRKKRRGRHDAPHRTRPEHKARNPVHVTMRARHEVGRLRKRPIFQAVGAALRDAEMGETFRVVHVSVQGNHIHMLVEAADKDALSKGMQRLTIAIARAINKSLRRRGKVFAYRYHAVYITSPRQARGALAYVLNNWRRHREDVTTPGAENELVDPYSTAYAFDGWRDVEEVPSYERLPAAAPRTWLLRVGWRRHGLIGAREVPGPM